MSSQSLMLCEAANFLRKNFQRPVHINTIRRWVDKGVLVHGQLVKLRSERLGWRIYTRPEWIEKFITDCTDRKEPASVTERQGVPANVLMRLKARGFDGPDEKRKVLGVSKRGSSARTMPRVLPVGALRDQNKPNNGTRVSGAKVAAAPVQGATVGLSLATREGSIET